MRDKPLRPVPPAAMPRFDARYGKLLPAADVPQNLRDNLSSFVPSQFLQKGRKLAFVREMQQQPESPIWQQMLRAAEELGVPAPRHLYCVDTNVANAFGDYEAQSVMITQGLCHAVDEDALRAVFRHELQHLQQPNQPAMEALEEEARRDYDPAQLPRHMLMPYSRPHAILHGIMAGEDEAVMAESLSGIYAHDAIRANEQQTCWNALLTSHKAAGETYLAINPDETIYRDFVQPNAQTLFEGNPELIALVQQLDWRRFVTTAPTQTLFMMADLIEDVIEERLSKTLEEREDELRSHPTHSERYLIHQQLGALERGR